MDAFPCTIVRIRIERLGILLKIDQSSTAERLECREEGVLAFWKGNGTNIIRIFPYSAAQLSANDFYKRHLSTDGQLSVGMRLTSGACAGMTATALTHPLDTLRLRLALPNHGYTGAKPP